MSSCGGNDDEDTSGECMGKEEMKGEKDGGKGKGRRREMNEEEGNSNWKPNVQNVEGNAPF